MPISHQIIWSGFFFFSQPANVSIPNFQRCHPFKKKKKTQTVPRDLPMESRRPVSLSFFFLFPSSSSATTEGKRSLSDAFLGAAPNATGLQLYFSSMPERKTRPAGKQATLFYSFLVLFFFLNVYPFKKNKKINKNKRREQKNCVCVCRRREVTERERERDWAYVRCVCEYWVWDQGRSHI
jgi:hypothetical protein